MATEGREVGTSRHALAAAMASMLVLLAGCGGGSDERDGSSRSPDPVAPPPRVNTQAYRFLNQATFGATEASAERFGDLDDRDEYASWIDEQLAAEPSLQLPYVQAAFPDPAPRGFKLRKLHEERIDIWFQNLMHGEDQLRQRVAWALSQIMVVSEVELADYPLGLADYYDMLARNALGDFRTLMTDVTLHPMMGAYLSMLGNQKPDSSRNIRPDENYAREFLQLFTVGLVRLNPDGTPQLDADGQPLPTFDQEVVEGFAHVFTGWKWACAEGSPSGCDFDDTRPTPANQVRPMQAFDGQHSRDGKRLLDYSGAQRVSLPAQQAAEQDLAAALDNVFFHPNVGPFIARQLIQKLVASNPSPDYVARVSVVFDDDGSGNRGNLAAVVRAILLDDEARAEPSGPTAGKVREPLLRLTQLWRAYDARAANGRYADFDPTDTLGQGPLTAPSVFNFFSPFYAAQGAIADRELVSPELQLATEYQNALTANFFYKQAFKRTSHSDDVDPDTVVIDIEGDVHYAPTPASLVASVANRLLGGEISDPLREEVERQVGRVSHRNARQRVAEAIWLIAASPEYAVQR
jgi:uncharacterized protein (DUF1800 family)